MIVTNHLQGIISNLPFCLSMKLLVDTVVLILFKFLFIKTSTINKGKGFQSENISVHLFFLHIFDMVLIN